MNRLTRFAFIAILILGATLRYPGIHAGLPYLYNEDEAHHFNRTVNMVKSGDWNPHYFHKPSLHFYLRIPVVAASFIWSVKNGDLRSVKEIITSDPNGVAGYSFSVSHERIMVWNRAFSFLLSILTLVTLFFLVRDVTRSERVALIAALLCAVAPEIIAEASVVGVDTPMAFLVVLATYLCVRAFEVQALSSLYLGAFVAGLAISTKYNALPVALVPLVASLYLKDLKLQSAALSLGLIAVGFCAGSPFLFAEFPRFLDQLAYEVWHYRIAGHEGNTAEPGIRYLMSYTKDWIGSFVGGSFDRNQRTPQLYFYLHWLFTSQLGIVATIAGFLGLGTAWKFGRQGVIFLVFPVAFFALMCSQRANFTRNMVAFLPFFCGAAAMGASMMINRKRAFAIAAAIVLAILPFRYSLTVRASFAAQKDSRVAFAEWFQSQSEREVAVQSNLQLARRSIPYWSVPEIDPISLWMKGFNLVAAGKNAKEHFFADPIRVFDGAGSGDDRIVKDPYIAVHSLVPVTDPDTLRGFVESSQNEALSFQQKSGVFQCSGNSGESYCWANSRVSKVVLSGLRETAVVSESDGVVSLSFQAMSPWKDQRARITSGDFLNFVDLPLSDIPGEWKEVTVRVPASDLREAQSFILAVNRVHSPKLLSISDDSRRLGLAIKDIKVGAGL